VLCFYVANCVLQWRVEGSKFCRTLSMAGFYLGAFGLTLIVQCKLRLNSAKPVLVDLSMGLAGYGRSACRTVLPPAVEGCRTLSGPLGPPELRRSLSSVVRRRSIFWRSSRRAVLYQDSVLYHCSSPAQLGALITNSNRGALSEYTRSPSSVPVRRLLAVIQYVVCLTPD
jgi:hypothetical protein